MSLTYGDGRIKHPCFPQELFDLVIDCIKDVETLKSFSLAGRAYRPRCKSRLFRRIVLSLPGYKTAVERLDSDTLNIYRSVRHLTLRGAEEPIAAILDDSEGSDASTESDCDSDTKSDTEDDTPDSSQIDLSKALQDIDQLAAFLRKLTRLERLTIEELGWDGVWSRPDALLPPNILATVNQVELGKSAFSTLADLLVFLTSFDDLRHLHFEEVYWDDDSEPAALTKAEKAASTVQPLRSLRILQSWATASADILSYVVPEETVPTLQLRQLEIDCLHRFEVPEWQTVLDRSGECLEDLHVRLGWYSHGEDGEGTFDFTKNTMLRSLTFYFYESSGEQEGRRIQDMLLSVSSTVIEEIRFVLGGAQPYGLELWDHIGLGMIDDILDNHAQFRGLQKVAFAVDGNACSVLECVPSTMQKAVKERMPKIAARIIEIYSPE